MTEEWERKIDLDKKVKQFILLMKDISTGLSNIVAENKEDEYLDILKDMLKALDQSQDMIRKAYYSYIAKRKN